MSMLVLGLVIFFIPHSVSIFNSPWRDQMAEKIGEWPWKGVYSVVSIVGFMLIIWGYAEARQSPVILYIPPTWLRHVAMVLLIPVFVLLLAAYMPGRIKTATRHPMLLATKIWALAHLLTNGMLADVVLFGSFLIWAVADRISMKHRTARIIPGALASKANDVIAVVLGLGLYAAFVFWLHTRLIGMPLIL